MDASVGDASMGDAFVDDTPPVQLVNPFIGSGGKLARVGSTFVGAMVPFGLAKPGPDTTSGQGDLLSDHFSGYYYWDGMVNGFSQIHIHGTGAVDYGMLLLMPTVGFDAEKTREFNYRSSIDKDTEQASPGYYGVTLTDHDIRAELTATRRAAMHRYTFQSASPDDEGYVIVDLSHVLITCSVEASRLQVDPDKQELSGFLTYMGSFTKRYGGITLHFVIRFDQPFTDWTVWQEGQLLPKATEAEGADVGLALRVDTAKPVQVRLGLSFVDEQGARDNLQSEIGERDFDTVHDEAEQAWARALGSIEVQGGSPDQRAIFYSSLFHSMFSPIVFTDADRRYLGFDGQVHTASDFEFYSDITMWDTYRVLHALLILIEPRVQRDLVVSMLTMLEQGGRLPRCPVGTGYGGCMIATPEDCIIAETFLKGIRDFDVDRAYAAMKEHATTLLEAGGRDGVDRYLELGYVPADTYRGGTSKTLEFVVQDAAIAALAQELDQPQDAKEFSERSKSYRNLWDPDLEFFRAKGEDGARLTEADAFDPTRFEGDNREYMEGNAWHYLWHVPHDPGGLAELFGSNEAMRDKLEAFFATPETNYVAEKLGYSTYYWHGNEPDIHAVYMFDAIGAADRTQHWVREVMSKEYTNAPDGLAGNDDCGTLSSWYVFSAMGFYPVPGQTRYYLGSPLFARVTIHLDGDKTFEVITEGVSDEKRFIQSAKLNGKVLEVPWFDHSDIAGGGTLELVMGSEPASW